MGVLLAYLLGFGSSLLALLVTSLVLNLFGASGAGLPLDGALLMSVILALALWRLRRSRENPTWPMSAVGVGVAALYLLFTRGNPFGATQYSWAGMLASFVGIAAAGLLTGYAGRGIGLSKPGSDSWETVLLRFLRAVGFTFFIAAVVLPFWFMFVAALKPRVDFITQPTNLAPPLHLFDAGFWAGLSATFSSFGKVLVGYHFLTYIANSSLVSVITTVLTLLLAVLGAYAVARLEFSGKRLVEGGILLIYMFPAIVLAIPLYTIFSQLGLRNTRTGLVIVYLAQTLPVALYMLRSYFETIPRSLEEAGMIDGAGRFEVIWRITLPLSLPALASVGLYVFMIAWNEFLFAFMFLDTPSLFTLSRGMMALNSQEVPRQFLMAGAVIVTVPIMVLFFWFEKYLVGGLTAGGVKG